MAKKSSSARKLDPQWAKLIGGIPGYDPCATAGECWFDAEAARYHIEFVESCCTFTQGDKAGQPFVLEPWQKSIIANLYGWKRPDGARRYRTCLFYVPRGNGKSEFSAVLVIIALYLSEAPGAQLYSAAAKRDQARFVFTPVQRMIENCAEMKDRADIFKTAIVVGDKSYKTISREATTEHGGVTYLAVVDELHAQPDRELVDVLRTSAAKHPRSLVVYATTADYERDGSICNEIYDYACKVRDNRGDPAVPGYDAEFLPIIYEAPKDSDWRDPKTWAIANPNLDVSIRSEDIAKLVKEAQESPGFENTVKRLHLNIRTEAVSRWLSSESWEACEDREMRLEQFAGQPCWCGLDLSSISDFTAFSLTFRRTIDLGTVIPAPKEYFYTFPFFWAPRATAVKRERKSRIPYSVWERQGYLELTEGNEIDYDMVRARINNIVKQYKLQVKEIAVDRLFQGLDICRRLREDDGYKDRVIEHGQGFLSMALPTRETERLVIGERLHHPGHPILNWMVANTIVSEDAAGNKKPNREKSTDKIDGVISTVMSVGRALADQSPDVPSFASTGGVRVL